MSTTGVTIATGARIRIGRGVTPNWTVLAGIGDFDFPAGTTALIDITSHSSPNDTVERMPGLFDNGSINVPIDWLPGAPQDQLLRFLKDARELIQIGFLPRGGATADEEVYAGYVENYVRSAPVNGKAQGTLTFTINGIVSGQATDPDLGGGS